MPKPPQSYEAFSGIKGYWCDKPEVLRLRVDRGVRSKTLDKVINQSSMRYMIWILKEDHDLLYETI